MKKIVLSIITGLLVFTACNDEDFLDKKPHSPTDVSFYPTVAGATQSLMAAYDVLQLGERVERIEFTGTVCSGDAMAGGQPGGGDQSHMQNIMKFLAASSGNDYISAYWAAIYSGIYRCNILLQYLEDKATLVDFPSDDVLRLQLKAEALFLRGLFHFKLQIFYGGYPQLQPTFNNGLKGVPFIDKVLSASEWSQTRPEISETWDKIEKDFQDAADLLKNRDEYSADYRGRATKGAALAMLAKSHLYQNEFTDAYPIFESLIASNQYKLMGENGEKFTITRTSKEGNVDVQVPGYKYIWQPEANNCDESIFDVQHYADHSTRWPEGEEGSLVATYYRPRNVLAYNANGVLTSQNIGWGFILPTTYFLKTAYKNVGCEPAELDPRFKLSVFGEHDSLPFYYTDEVLRSTYPDSVMYDAWFNWPCTGYATWKYFEDPIFNRDNTQLGDNPMNTKYFRFADLLLMGAEAAVQTGHADKALEWINRVRTRARNSGNTGYPLNLTAVTLEDVYAERRVELAFEGHQFFDIVRTGRAEKILKQDAIATPEFKMTTHPDAIRSEPQQFGDQFQVGKNEILPIPQSEIDLSGGVLTQNPGY
jgi:starch-binding outer membrane protein, SusD/RagB family